MKEFMTKQWKIRRSVANSRFSPLFLFSSSCPASKKDCPGSMTQSPFFLVWNISFNASDHAPRGFLFGLLKLCSFQIPAGFSELASYGPQGTPYGPYACALSWRLCASVVEPSVWLGRSCTARTECHTGRMKSSQIQFFAIFPAKYQTKHSSTTFHRNISKKSTFIGFKAQVSV